MPHAFRLAIDDCGFTPGRQLMLAMEFASAADGVAYRAACSEADSMIRESYARFRDKIDSDPAFEAARSSAARAEAALREKVKTEATAADAFALWEAAVSAGSPADREYAELRDAEARATSANRIHGVLSKAAAEAAAKAGPELRNALSAERARLLAEARGRLARAVALVEQAVAGPFAELAAAHSAVYSASTLPVAAPPAPAV